MLTRLFILHYVGFPSREQGQGNRRKGISQQSQL
jgi:hypothetical protein